MPDICFTVLGLKDHPIPGQDIFPSPGRSSDSQQGVRTGRAGFGTPKNLSGLSRTQTLPSSAAAEKPKGN